VEGAIPETPMALGADYRTGERRRRKKEPAPLALWFAGGPVTKKDSLKFVKEVESSLWRVKSSRGFERPASIMEMVPSAENGMPMRPSAPNGKPMKSGWFYP